MIKVICTKDYDDMSLKAADIIAAQVARKPDSVLGLATGSSPLGLYGELTERYENGGLDFSKVRAVNLDEYKGLSPYHDQSYAYFMRKNLFDRINIDPSLCFIPDGLNDDAESECARYHALIGGLGGIDLQLLGIGVNGHIGFNEPCDEFPDGTHTVKLSESTIKANSRFFASAGDVPEYAYSMGIGEIMAARRVIVIASGKSKAGAVTAMLKGPVTPYLPASILRFHPDATLIADEEALACAV